MSKYMWDWDIIFCYIFILYLLYMLINIYFTTSLWNSTCSIIVALDKNITGITTIWSLAWVLLLDTYCILSVGQLTLFIQWVEVWLYFQCTSFLQPPPSFMRQLGMNGWIEGDAWTAPAGDDDKVNIVSMSQSPYLLLRQQPDLYCHQQFRM